MFLPGMGEIMNLCDRLRGSVQCAASCWIGKHLLARCACVSAIAMSPFACCCMLQSCFCTSPPEQLVTMQWCGPLLRCTPYLTLHCITLRSLVLPWGAHTWLRCPQVPRRRQLGHPAALHRCPGGAAARLPAAPRGRAQGRGGHQHCGDEPDDRGRGVCGGQRQAEGAAVQRGAGAVDARARQRVAGAARLCIACAHVHSFQTCGASCGSVSVSLRQISGAGKTVVIEHLLQSVHMRQP